MAAMLGLGRMSAIDPHLRLARPLLRHPATALMALAIVAAPLVGLGAHLLAPAAGWEVVLLAAAFLAAMVGVAVCMRRGYGHDRMGACNAVTLLRAGLAAVLAVAVLRPEVSGLALFGLAATALSLDGADGWLARRSGLASGFGARFDMEVDAALATILALVLLRAGLAEGPVSTASLLVLGFARHVFLAASLVLPWLARPLTERLSRKLVCVLQIGTLTALLLPALHGLASLLLPVAAGLVLWSFARDLRVLARG